MEIKELTLQTADLQALADFYGNQLGLHTSIGKEGSLLLQAGNSNLVFEKTTISNQPFYHFAFNIPFHKVEEAKTWLAAKVPLLWLDDYNGYIAEFKSWEARSVYFLDPAGNIVELIGRAGVVDTSTAPFSPALIRNISEAGLVYPVSNFVDSVDRLAAENNWPYFSRRPPSADFRVIGNDEGLLICVPENRNWYPTHDKPATGYPVKLTVVEEGRETKLVC